MSLSSSIQERIKTAAATAALMLSPQAKPKGNFSYTSDKKSFRMSNGNGSIELQFKNGTYSFSALSADHTYDKYVITTSHDLVIQETNNAIVKFGFVMTRG